MADNQAETLRHQHVRNPNRNSFNRHKSHSGEEPELAVLPLSEPFDMLGFIRKPEFSIRLAVDYPWKDNKGRLIGEI